MPISPLNTEAILQGVAYLSAIDSHLAKIAADLGPPPLWAREPGFPTLVYIILEQQVSLASARAAYTRLQETLGVITPGAFLQLGDEALKKIGFSRQKTSYCRGLAHSILQGELDLVGLSELNDASARSALMKVKGIGPWTADIYLLMALLRPDIWPVGDLALAAAIQKVKGLPALPDAKDLEHIAAPWRPWRAVAARLLWSYYLAPL
jgi:DNA-3-methyladenine glycosylase II